MNDSSHPRSFARQDLRNYSFKRQHLNDADFTGADLRGCHFNGAQLMNANFQQAKMGQSLRQQMVWVGAAIATFLIVGHTISTLVASSLGQTPTDKAWNYVITLVISLGIAGAGQGLRSLLPVLFKRVAELLSSVAAGAVVGFYYAGVATDKDPRWAIVGAGVAGVVTGLGCLLWRRRTILVVSLRLAGALTAYGFSFLLGATGLACLNVGMLLPGGGLMGLSLLYLWFTLTGLVEAVQVIRQAPGTSFRRANLTHAQFSAPMSHTDFTEAVGWIFEEKTNFQDGG